MMSAEVSNIAVVGRGPSMPSYLAEGLTTVLDALRSGPVTQPKLTRLGLGRAVVAQRVSDLESIGLIAPAGLAPSSGGRAPKQLRLRAEAGLVVGIDCGATGMTVALADLDGRILVERSETIDIADGPDAVLAAVERVIDLLLTTVTGPGDLTGAGAGAGSGSGGSAARGPIWGIGMSVPGPVEFATGVPVAPPIMPGWDGYPIRERLGRRYGAPVWVDNDVNVMALGEYRTNPVAAAERDVLCIKLGTGIGAGLISNGHVHRGANGSAGDVGHVVVPGAGKVECRCGNVGCLEAAAGGAAIARDGLALAESGKSPLLAERCAETGRVTALDVLTAATHGCVASRALVVRVSRLIGSTLATLVNFYNPGLIVMSGNIAHGGDLIVAAVRESIYRRSLPLATRTLRVELSSLGRHAGVLGAVHLVLDSIFEPRRLAVWLPLGTPAGHPEIAGPVPARVA